MSLSVKLLNIATNNSQTTCSWWYPYRHTSFAASRYEPPLTRGITSSWPCSNARWACTDCLPNSTHPVRATIFTIFRTLSNYKRSGTLEIFEPRVAARLLIRLWTQCVPIVSFIALVRRCAWLRKSYCIGGQVSLLRWGLYVHGYCTEEYKRQRFVLSIA